MITLKQIIEVLQKNELLLSVQSQNKDVVIFGKPVTNSRLLEKDDIFICIKGFTSDGHNFIQHAREKSASIIIQETDYVDTLPAIKVTDSRKAAALITKVYYNNPTSKFTLIGVTGTNGKTTTSLLVWQALNALGYKTGWIGTLGYRVGEEIIPTNNTTPDIIELNQIFDRFVCEGCKYVVMEVSSHAIALDRVYGLEFDYAIFTNLTQDHLDFHQNMEEYFLCKTRLFHYTIQNNGKCFIYTDDLFGQRLASSLKMDHADKVLTISEVEGDIVISDYIGQQEKSVFKINYSNNGKYVINSKLNGHFNVVNLTLALAVINDLNPSIDQALIDNLTDKLVSVKGRLERIDNEKGIGVFVDYAHTPDALENVLKTCKEIPHNRLLVLFGAGGDRDKGKRPQMLSAALKYANAVIISDDNPRSENPKSIIRDIISEAQVWSPWWIIRDRKQAIQSIINLAKIDDIVVIAGKGHENYQEIQGVKHYFDDSEIARECLNSKKGKKSTELAIPIDSMLLEVLYNTGFHSDNQKEQISYYKNASTDSRKIKSNSVFFALKGENFDGHDYLDKVLEDNTNCAVISVNRCERTNTILYYDTIKAYSMLAKKYLMMFGVYKIALTGSTGKTTTKEFLASIYSIKHKVLKTEANDNNIIGLCNTIFRIKPDDEIAVFELGTNHFGEIETMADVCMPDTSMITNIGASHLEHFGDEAGVYREKTALFRRELKTIFFPGDDERFSEFVTKGKRVGYHTGCEYQIKDVAKIDTGYEFCLNDARYFLRIDVSYYIINLAFAIACAKESGFNYTDIRLGIDKKVDLGMRMEIRNFGRDTYIFDCYNANPLSMQSAIDFWKSYKSEKKHIAILGDMLELGKKSIDFHKQIGEQLADIDYDRLITIGDLAKNYSAFNNATNSHKLFEHHNNIDELLLKPFMPLYDGDVCVLLKASHGVHLEKVIELIEDYYQNLDNVDKAKQRGE